MTGPLPIPSADALRRTTAPALLMARAGAAGSAMAFRSKKRGLYRERTWRDYAGMVARTAKALDQAGLKPGERLAIMGDPCEEWLVVDMAAQALGAIVYGIYPTASAGEVEFQLRDGGAAIFVAEDQEHVDKALPLLPRLPNLRQLIVIDGTGMFAARCEKLALFDALLAAAGEPDFAFLAARVSSLRPEQPAFIVYTSGTTGNPKGALVAHGKHLAATRSVVTHYPTLAEKPHRTVAFLPLCHVLGRDIATTLPLLGQLVPHFGVDLDDLPATLFEVAPTVLFTVPRYLQKLAAQLVVGARNTTRLKRFAFEQAMRHARAQVERRRAGTAPSMQAQFWRAAVFRPVLNKVGFDKLELVVCGGAPLPAETMTLWHMFGVNVVEMYGQTETAGGIVAGQRGPFPWPGNVGVAPDGVEVRLGEDDEILVASPDLFEGYWRHPEASAAARDASGLLRTGDVGEWHDGNLRIVDRARDFIVTSGGKTISPSFVENRLRASPYVGDAVVFGHGRKYLSALIEIDFETVADWARAHDVAYAGFTSLAQNAAVQGLLDAEIRAANAAFARVEQVKAFRILPKELDSEAEGEPVTPTGKIKRKQMYERFRGLVDGMYDDSEEKVLAESVADAPAAQGA